MLVIISEFFRANRFNNIIIIVIPVFEFQKYFGTKHGDNTLNLNFV